MSVPSNCFEILLVCETHETKKVQSSRWGAFLGVGNSQRLLAGLVASPTVTVLCNVHNSVINPNRNGGNGCPVRVGRLSDCVSYDSHSNNGLGILSDMGKCL